MKTKKVKITCSAGFSIILDIVESNEFDYIEEFIAYDSTCPDDAFMTECADCNISRIGLRFSDKDERAHIVKMCSLSIKDE